MFTLKRHKAEIVRVKKHLFQIGVWEINWDSRKNGKVSYNNVQGCRKNIVDSSPFPHS